MSNQGSQDKHFRTDHLIADLKGRSMRGGAITLGSQAIKFVLQLGSTVILARLLTPEDFGLVAMVTAVTGFVALFKDLGLSQATVQRADITHAQVSTLFWINVAVSILLMLLIALLSPLLAWLYDEPRLATITLVIAGTFIFGGLSTQHGALLTRQMRFKWLALIDVVSLTVGVVFALAIALLGAGYWSIVGMLVAQSVTNAVLVWHASGWRPGRPVRGSGVRPMLRFGGNLAGFNILNYFSRNADNVLIGWYWGANALGIYSRSYQLLTLPLSQVNWPLSRVVTPTLSRLLNAPEDYRRHYLSYLSATLWLTLPIVALLAGSAPSVVHVLLGEQWSEVTEVFRVLCITAALQPIYSTIGWIFVSTGRTDRFLRWAFVSTPLFTLSFLLGLPWGILGIAFSYSVVFIVMLPWTMHFALRGTNITLTDLLQTAKYPGFHAFNCLVVCLAIDALALSAAMTLVICLALVALFSMIAVYLNRDLWEKYQLIFALNRASDGHNSP